MKRSIIASLILLALAAATAAASAAGSEPLARVDGQPITGDDLERAFRSRHGGHLAFLAGESEVREALGQLIDRTLLLDEAERLEIGDRPEIREAVDELVDRLAVEHLLAVEVSRPAEPSEAEIRAAYDEYTDELLKVRHLVVAERAAADAVAARLAAGEPFAELAGELSQAASRRSDGLLPPIRWGTMGTAWDDAAFALEPGQVSAPFWNDHGWEFVELLERLPVERPAWEQAKPVIQGVLLRRKLAERQAALSARLVSAYGVKVELQPYDPARYAAAGAEDAETPVATWKGGRLAIGELAAEVDLAGLARLGPDAAAAALADRVRRAVNERLAHLEADARGYRELPEVQAAAGRLRDELMESALYEEFVLKEVTVADEEVRTWYDGHREELQRPERRRVGQILLGGEEEARAARRRLAAGEDFAELAGELSRDAESAPRGGDLGWITARESPPGFAAVFELGEGEVSEPIESSLGWHLIRVSAIEPARTPQFAEAADEARDRLREEKRRQARERWLAILREAAEVEIDDRAVRAFAARQAE